jgi:hypothetical protein
MVRVFGRGGWQEPTYPWRSASKVSGECIGCVRVAICVLFRRGQKESTEKAREGEKQRD